MRNITRILKFVLLPIGILLLAFSFLLAMMQTEWMKKKLSAGLISWAKQNGIELSFEGIEGTPPFKFKLHKVELKWGKNSSLSIESIHLRLSLVSILRKSVSIPYLFMDNVLCVYEESDFVFSEKELPFNLSIRKLKIPSLSIGNYQKKKRETFSLDARISYKNKGRRFSLAFHANEKAEPSNFAEVAFSGNKKQDLISCLAKFHAHSLTFFEPFWTFPFDAELSAQIDMRGSWNSFLAFLSLKHLPDAPVKGFYTTHIQRLEIPGHPLFNREWKSAGNFHAWAERCLEIKNCKIESDLIRLKGEGQLDLALHPQKGNAEVYLPELALFSSYLSLPIKGALHGKTQFDEKEWKASLSGNSLKIAHQPFEKSSVYFKAIHEGNLWNGKARLTLEHPTFALQGVSDFTLDPHTSLSLHEIQLTAPDTKVAGELSYTFAPKALDGALFGYAYRLSHFQPLFPGSKLEGNLGAELRFLPHKDSQSLECHLFLKNLHYFDYLANEASVHLELDDLFGKPSGKCSLAGEKLHLSKVSFSNLTLDTAYREDKWAFAIDAKGKWKDPFEVQTSGSWKEEKKSQLVEIDTLTGFMLKNSFTLQEPLFISWSPDFIKVADCAFHVGHGDFFADIDMSKEKCMITVEAEQFPLDYFTLAHPTFNLKGSTSFDGFIHASPEGGIEGKMNLVLEEANVLEQGQKEPLLAKGSLQAHLNQETVQIHADIKAEGEQFLEYTATLPVDYTLFPFSLHLNRERRLSSELTVEGKLQEIFDFVNMGSHRATGLLSSHLFLSNTLSSPALLGSIELQDGTYENYFTGTQLKEVSSVATAQSGEILLNSFAAKDEQGNPVTAQGTFFLQPDKDFPYTLDFDLSRVTSIRFDSVVANFTGPLHVTGTSKGALASGNLLVPQADLKIPEKLISDLPVLPITYLNAPVHLQAFQIHPHPSFLLELDLSLTAPTKVFVKGKGLNSEWRGDVHLTGSNLTFNLNGALSLLKGDFLFAGKIFNLTQGEITFSDKPTQSAYIQLSGTLTQQGITITAQLQGPFSSPQLTFQSVPQMPTSSVLSLVLFNKDVSEISPFEAVQLAQAIVSLSGGAGPDVLEAIRKSIGVDRLSIVSSSTGSDEIALQIGKYLTRGVMITLAQGATSSQVIVEVDLKNGFLFQAETQEDESGKFSLKWNKNY